MITPAIPAAIVDASAIVALVDRDDATHEAAVNAYHSLVEDGYRLFTTNHAFAEAHDLISTSLGENVAREWLDRQALPIYVTDSADEEQARKRICENTSGKRLRYTDAISYVVMERLGVQEAFAVDPDFLAHLD